MDGRHGGKLLVQNPMQDVLRRTMKAELLLILT